MFSRQHSTNQDHLLNLQHKAEHYSAATLSSVDFYTNSVRFGENGVYWKISAKGEKVTHSANVNSDFDIFPSAQTTKIKRMFTLTWTCMLAQKRCIPQYLV